MFLHLGENTVVREKDIIGIFDLDTSTVMKSTRDFLTAMSKAKRVINVGYELPKSFVLTYDKKTKEKTMYISPISSVTLLKRIENVNYISSSYINNQNQYIDNELDKYFDKTIKILLYFERKKDINTKGL